MYVKLSRLGYVSVIVGVKVEITMIHNLTANCGRKHNLNVTV